MQHPPVDMTGVPFREHPEHPRGSTAFVAAIFCVLLEEHDESTSSWRVAVVKMSPHEDDCGLCMRREGAGGLEGVPFATGQP